MPQEIVKNSVNQTLTITQQNWQQTFALIQVKADTPAAVITASETPQLCVLGKDSLGIMVGVQVFTILIASTAAFMDGKWSREQVNECGQLAYEECYWFTIAELKQFLSRIKTGFYTSHKNFSPAVFMEYLKIYSDERLEERYNYHSQAKPKEKLEPGAELLSDAQMDILKNSIASFAENMGQSVKAIESEEDYQRIRSEAHTKLMQRRLKED